MVKLIFCFESCILKNSADGRKTRSRTLAACRKRKREGTMSEARSGSQRPPRDQSGISTPEVKTTLLFRSI